MKNQNSYLKPPRKGCKDIWNAEKIKGAHFGKYDIVDCPTTAKEIPSKIITYEEALNIYHQEMKKKHKNFSIDAFVIFSIDDYKFDKGINGIWEHVDRSLKILRHFKGVVTPDFSTYIDFPEPIKLYNTFRMRAYGYIAAKSGLEVINNVRWDSSNDYKYCFIGIPKNSMVLVATVASQLRNKENYSQFENGFWRMIDELCPKAILVYGSANYPCFEKAKTLGIIISPYPGATSSFYRRLKDEQGL